MVAYTLQAAGGPMTRSGCSGWNLKAGRTGFADGLIIERESAESRMMPGLWTSQGRQ